MIPVLDDDVTNVSFEMVVQCLQMTQNKTIFCLALSVLCVFQKFDGQDEFYS